MATSEDLAYLKQEAVAEQAAANAERRMPDLDLLNDLAATILEPYAPMSVQVQRYYQFALKESGDLVGGLSDEGSTLLGGFHGFDMFQVMDRDHPSLAIGDYEVGVSLRSRFRDDRAFFLPVAEVSEMCDAENSLRREAYFKEVEGYVCADPPQLLDLDAFIRSRSMSGPEVVAILAYMNGHLIPSTVFSAVCAVYAGRYQNTEDSQGSPLCEFDRASFYPIDSACELSAVYSLDRKRYSLMMVTKRGETTERIYLSQIIGVEYVADR